MPKLQPKHMSILPLLITGWLLVGGSVHAELRWTSKAPSTDHATHQTEQGKKPASSQSGGHAQHDQRRGKTLYLNDSSGAELRMITPTLESRALQLEDDGQLKVPSTGMSNYHALIASRQGTELHESALRYEYLRGKPPGRSPSELMDNNKLPLEIVPDPMAREHGRFYSLNAQAFVIRFKGKPLSDSRVWFSSSNGSELEAVSDADGKIVFTLPDDFSHVRPGRSNNKSAEFTLRTGHVDGTMHYRTNFTTPYSVNPSHWQSSTVGFFMLLAGFGTGIVVMRRQQPSATSNKRAEQQPRRSS